MIWLNQIRCKNNNKDTLAVSTSIKFIMYKSNNKK